MDQTLHGYYIHGRATWHESDLPLLTLKLRLDEEEKNKDDKTMTEQRGINGDVNTYEIYFTSKLRTSYDRAYNGEFLRAELKKKAIEEDELEKSRRTDVEEEEDSDEQLNGKKKKKKGKNKGKKKKDSNLSPRFEHKMKKVKRAKEKFMTGKKDLA
jgi:hypothetical protein